MTKSEKIFRLRRALQQAETVRTMETDDPTFRSWRHLTTRALETVFGLGSTEFAQFSSLKFFYNPMVYSLGDDFTYEHRQCFERDFKIAKSLLQDFIQEIETFGEKRGRSSLFSMSKP